MLASDPLIGGEPITIVLADHQPFTRTLLAERIVEAGGFNLVAEVTDATAALAACSQAPNPALLLLRSDLPGYSPFAASRTLRLQNLLTHSAVIFPTILDHQLDEAIASNTQALFSYEDPPAELIHGLRELAKHGQYRAPSIEQRMVTLRTNESSSSQRASPFSTLTNRERDILRLIAEGMTQRQIAERMELAPKTIDNHAGKVMAKLGIHNRVLLTRYAIREGIVTADAPATRPESPSR